MPVPCVATRAGRRGAEGDDEEGEGDDQEEAEADATTPLIRAACAGPEGAVRLEDLPSCPTAEATSRAIGEIPEKEEEEEEKEEEEEEEERAEEDVSEGEGEGASASRHSTAARNPSPLPYPSADASNVLHLPSGDRACSPEMVHDVIGSSSALTPPTTAASASKEGEGGGEESFTLPLRLPLPLSLPLPLPLPLPAVSALNARCAATSDAEHAVSVATQGPCSPNANETRPQRYEMPLPVATAGLADAPRSPASYWSCACSWNIDPVKTAVLERTSGEEKKGGRLEGDDDEGGEDTERSAEPAASRRCRHCGSVAAASAGESPNAAESKSSSASTSAAHRA